MCLFVCASYILINLPLTTPSAQQQLSVSLEKGKNCAQWGPEGFYTFSWENGAAVSN